MCKPTDLWVHNLPQLVNFLGTEENPKFICTEESPCHMGGPGRHADVRGNTKAYTAFPSGLVVPWQSIVDASLAPQRRTVAVELDDE